MSSTPIRVSPDDSIAAIAVRCPGAVRVFERLGIDYCCGGKRPAGAAVAEKGLDWQTVAAALEAAGQEQIAEDDPDAWVDAPLSGLVGHILARYHAKLREDLPRLAAMGDKVVGAHGANHPEVLDAALIFAGLRNELDAHMMKEEHILFPFIEALDEGRGGAHPMLGHIASPLAVMEREHDSAGEALAALRRLTTGYLVPGDACTTFRAYYEGLAAFERDLHSHIHLENNVLFPRARRAEAQALAER
jgi:regulator of cell morphogenesis and NO signaling